MPELVYHDRKRNTRYVHNLGWLNKNWGHIRCFEFHKDSTGGGEIIVRLNHGTYELYKTYYNSLEVFKEWVCRSIFEYLPVIVYSSDHPPLRYTVQRGCKWHLLLDEQVKK